MKTLLTKLAAFAFFTLCIGNLLYTPQAEAVQITDDQRDSFERCADSYAALRHADRLPTIFSLGKVEIMFGGRTPRASDETRFDMTCFYQIRGVRTDFYLLEHVEGVTKTTHYAVQEQIILGEKLNPVEDPTLCRDILQTAREFNSAIYPPVESLVKNEVVFDEDYGEPETVLTRCMVSYRDTSDGEGHLFADYDLGTKAGNFFILNVADIRTHR